MFWYYWGVVFLSSEIGWGWGGEVKVKESGEIGGRWEREIEI